MSKTVEAPQSLGSESVRANAVALKAHGHAASFPRKQDLPARSRTSGTKELSQKVASYQFQDLEGDYLHRHRNGLLDRENCHLEEHIWRHAQMLQMRTSQQRISLAFD